MSELQKSLNALDDACELLKSGGPFIGPKGGKYKDAAHTQAWVESADVSAKSTKLQSQALKKVWAELHSGPVSLEYGWGVSAKGARSQVGKVREWRAANQLVERGLAVRTRLVSLDKTTIQRIELHPSQSESAGVSAPTKESPT